MAAEFAMKFPVYSLLLKDGSGVIMLRHGSDLWLPVFTDKDSVQTYLERSEINECCVIELATPSKLAEFLEKPPSRAENAGCDTVVVDPLDPGPRTFTLFKIADLLNSLRS